MYAVYFDPYQYVKYVERFPNLLQSGYGVGFARVYKSDSLWVHDPLIGVTISKIIADFVATYGDRTVLLYHCDTADAKQKGRNLIFHNWYNGSDTKHTVFKRSLEVETPSENGMVHNYIGYLTPVNNPDIDNVEAEFALFAENLIDNK